MESEPVATEADAAAKLIERLLSDPDFRARFRRDPAGTCREAGLEELAQEMSVAGGKAMMTLDMRESKSSLAGVMMAAAMEGVAIYQFTENLMPHLEEIPGQVADVLSRIDLPAIDLPDLKGVGGAGAAPAAAAAAAPPGELAGADAAAAAPPPPAAPPPAPPPELPEEPAEAKKPPKPPEAEPEKAKAEDPAKEAAKKIAEADSPEAEQKAAEKETADALDERTKGLPGSSDLPTGETAEEPAAAAPQDGAAPPSAPAEAPPAADPGLPTAPAAGDTGLPAAPAAGDTGLPTAPAEGDTGLPTAPAEGDTALPTESSPRPEVAPAPQPAAAVPVVEAPAPRAPIDPEQFGAEGKGGAPDPEALALLDNKNVVLDESGVADIKAGRIDPRVVAVLTKLSQEHKLTLSTLASDHDKLTSGGSISNHHLGRGMDIAAIDGEIVNPGSAVAREVASKLAGLDPEFRPSEIGCAVGDLRARLLHGRRTPGSPARRASTIRSPRTGRPRRRSPPGPRRPRPRRQWRRPPQQRRPCPSWRLARPSRRPRRCR